jgi:integrase
MGQRRGNALAPDTRSVVLVPSNTVSRERVEQNIAKRTTARGEVYEVEYRDAEGRQRRRTVKGGIQVARRVRNKLLSERDEGESVPVDPRLTFGKAADAYRADLDAREQDGDVSAETAARYRGVLDRHLLPALRTKRLTSIKAKQLDELVSALRAKGLAPRSILKALVVLSLVFDYARTREGWAGQNPVTGYDRRRKLVDQDDEKRIFRGDELGRVLDAADEPYRTLFLFLADTGARITEALHVRLNDLRLDDDPCVRIDGTKTKASRGTVSLSAATTEALREHLASEHAGTTYLFETRTGKPLDRHNVARVLRSALRKADIAVHDPVADTWDYQGLSLHSFRHLAASYRIDAGMSLLDVSRHLRHGDSRTTETIYAHEIKEAERRGRDREVAEAALAAAMTLT